MVKIYLKLGFTHILDLQAYDHMLFLLALVAIYLLEDWKKVLFLATSFTIGHSITLALSVLNLISFPSLVVELLIPVTIIISAIFNIWLKEDRNTSYFKYIAALLFGFIHGMGFSSLLRSSLMPGEGLFVQLLSFNIGIELGQILIVILLLGLNWLMVSILKIEQRIWSAIVSILAILVSLKIIFDLIYQ